MGSQFYLPPIHEPYLPLLPIHKACIALWLVGLLIVLSHEGMVRLS